MIVDIRYHIFTITAIFAALGLGILIGTSIIGNEVVLEEQNRIIQNIGIDIQRLKEENFELQGNLVRLQKELEQRRQREQQAFSVLLRDIIKGGNYLLYTDREEHGQDVKEIFRAAGAELSLAPEEEEIGGDFNKIIYWLDDNQNLDDPASLPDENALVYREGDLMGLILTIVEQQKDE